MKQAAIYLYNRKAGLSPPARCRSGQFHAAAYGASLSRQGAVPVL